MQADKQAHPGGNRGAETSGDARSITGSHSSARRGPDQRELRLIPIPDGAWERLAKEDVDRLELARRCLPLLAPARVFDFKSCLAVGRALHTTSTTLLPAWQDWASRNSYFTAACCASYWKRFPSFTGAPLTLGYLISVVRKDTGNAKFGKRGAL